MLLTLQKEAVHLTIVSADEDRRLRAGSTLVVEEKRHPEGSEWKFWPTLLGSLYNFDRSARFAQVLRIAVSKGCAYIVHDSTDWCSEAIRVGEKSL